MPIGIRLDGCIPCFGRLQIDGIPSADEGSAKEAKPEIIKEKGHIMVLIQNRDGLQIKKKNITYPELKQLVEKLEGLC